MTAAPSFSALSHVAGRGTRAWDAPPVEAGRLHEVLGDVEGLGVVLGWLTSRSDARASRQAWIGRSVWPGADVLQRASMLEAALLVDAVTPAERAWAAELCVRSGCMAAIVVDGNGFELTMTRRLQLVARDADCHLILLRRSGDGALSAAGSRWVVTPQPTARDPETGVSPRRPQWRVELVRHKQSYRAAGNDTTTLTTAGEMFRHEAAAHLAEDVQTAWIYEWDPRGGRAAPLGLPVGVPSALADRSAAPKMAWTG